MLPAFLSIQFLSQSCVEQKIQLGQRLLMVIASTLVILPMIRTISLEKAPSRLCTSHPLNGFLTPPSFGLGAQTSEAICVALKRPYGDSRSGVNLKHFDYADESRKVLTEGTLLGWPDSLLQFTYKFINDFIANQALVEVPFEVPQLWFLKAAIVYSEKSLDNALGASSSTSHCVAYLLEELLPTGNLFIKYIHNADAVPLQDHDEPGYNTAIFLCFIQHAQFILTHGQAYISDFQGRFWLFYHQAIFLTSSIIVALGTKHLITDPQVMTHL